MLKHGAWGDVERSLMKHNLPPLSPASTKTNISLVNMKRGHSLKAIFFKQHTYCCESELLGCGGKFGPNISVKYYTHLTEVH